LMTCEKSESSKVTYYKHLVCSKWVEELKEPAAPADLDMS